MTTLADYRSHIAKSLLENRVKLCDLWQQEVQGVAARNDFDVGPGDFQLDDLASIIEQISLILVNPDEPPSQADSIIERKASALGYLRFAQNRHVTELLNELNFMASLLEQAIVDATVEWDGRIELHEALHMLCITSDSMRNIKHSAMTAYAQQKVEGEELAEKNRIALTLSLSHEIRSPLQAAMLNVDLMIEDDQLSEDCLQCLLAVRSSIEEASMLIMKFQQEKALGNRE